MMTDQDQPDELDKLLEEAKPDDKATITLLQKIQKDQEEIKAEVKSTRELKTQEDVDAAVDALREKIPDAFKENPMFSSEALEDYLTRQAESDEGLKNAFLGRHKDRASWDKARSGLVDSFAKQFESIPDANATEDREAALASAKETKPADTPEFDEKAVGEMPKSDFDKLQRDMGVAPYGG